MLSIKDLFGGETPVAFEVKGQTVTFYFRNATTDEETEFRRKLGTQKYNSDTGKLEGSEAAVRAPIWLFNKLIQRITNQNGTGEIQDVPRDEYPLIPENIKGEALNAFRNSVKRAEAEQLRD